MVKATVRYTVRHFRQVLWNGSVFIAIIFLYAMFVFNLAITGLLLIAKIHGENVNSPLGIQIVFIPLLSLYLIYLTFFYEKTLFKQYQHMYPNTVSNFIFGENSFTIEECGDTHTSHQELSYDTCYKVIENNKWFLIYMTKTSAHIINKSEITEGTPAELRQLLTGRLGDKFTIKGK